MDLLQNLLRKKEKSLYYEKDFYRSYRKRNLTASEKKQQIAAIAASVLFLLTVANTNGAVNQLISPLTKTLSAFNPFTDHRAITQTFAFVPGSNPDKFAKIDFKNLGYLSFYDVPVNSDGTLNGETVGYQTFHTDDTTNLIQNAHSNGTKVLLTLSSTFNDDIASLLSNSQAQQALYSNAAQEVKNAGIDGVTIDFEYSGSADPSTKIAFTTFVQYFTNYLHQNLPGSIVSVALADNIRADGLYDVKALSDAADKTQLMAYSFAVPEETNGSLSAPVFGDKKTLYMQTLAKAESGFMTQAPSDKIVMERAWYGNGDNYHLYIPTPAPKATANTNTLTTPLSQTTINNLVATVPDNAKEAARKNLPYIAEALQEEGILNPNVLAYALATIQHETAGTFEPISEFKGNKSARRLGYEGGTDYYGRGFIQLTHLRNYKAMGGRIGMGDALAQNPSLASDPKIAAKVLAAYFKDNGVSDLASAGDFVDARTPINPDYNGWAIAEIAQEYLYALV